VRELDSLAANYTMQMERDVHESMAAGSAASVVGGPIDSDVLDVLGDNVELF
jgi:hypothetical protein